MTLQQFKSIGFTGNLFLLYRHEKFEVGSVDFGDRIIGFVNGKKTDSYRWVSYKDCEIIEKCPPRIKYEIPNDTPDCKNCYFFSESGVCDICDGGDPFNHSLRPHEVEYCSSFRNKKEML